MKKVLLILGVVLVGLTSCKKEEVEEVQSENCYFGEALNAEESIFAAQLFADFILSCGDTLGLTIYNPDYNSVDDHISNIDGDTTYWRIYGLDYMDSNPNDYFYDGNHRFYNGDSIMFIKINGKYINCNTWSN
jgi:hypothetical protein